MDSKYLDSRYEERSYAAPHYPQTLTLCSQRENSPVISEDQKPTTRLSPGCAKGYDSTQREELSLTLPDPAPTIDNPVGEIEIDSLRKADQILIETVRSVYVFTIKDPKAMAGRLAGGILGERLVDAYLLANQKSVKAGKKFIFIIDSGIGMQRLTTSTVKALVHKKKSGAARSRNPRQRVTLEQVSD